MKKLFISLAAIALLASCGNKQKANTEVVEEKSFEQEQIEANIKLQVFFLRSLLVLAAELFSIDGISQSFHQFR